MVNERDGLGDETPPDYLTSVRDGGFYGWPYCYWGQTVDDRVPQDPALVAKAITPDYALGGHTASLGLCWLPAGTLPGFPDGMAIGQHGSWNRSTLSGYKLVFVPFANGRPSGPPRDILSGFLAPDERVSYGRPVGVAIGPDGSLLMADDVGDVIWRVTGRASYRRLRPPALTSTLWRRPLSVMVGAGHRRYIWEPWPACEPVMAGRARVGPAMTH